MLYSYMEILTVLVVFLFTIIIYLLFADETPMLDKEKLRGMGVYRHIGNWRPAVPLIMLNIILIVLVTYGFYNLETFYVDADGVPGVFGVAATGYEAYAYVFLLFAFIHGAFLFLCGFFAVLESNTVNGVLQLERKQRWKK